MEGAFRSGAVLVGKYRIDRLLGRDGMCLVFAGIHLQMSLPVVLKILVPESVTSLAVHARFLREAQSVARLTGDHVARTVDVGILPEGVPYSVMEALHGIDLGSELARRGALTPGEAVDYILQACEALAEAHAHGIVHGELKPAHLFFAARPDGTMAVKVLGFELSRSVQGQPGARAASGTPGYQAPEQVKPIDELDGRADVWALGIVLYQCITGRHPFQADSVSLMQQAAANDSPRPMDPGIPRPLQAVVLRCLEKHRDARFPSIADLAAALAPFAHDQRTAAAIVDRASFMSHGLGGGYEVAPHGQYPIIAPPTVPAGYAPSRSRRRYATIGLGILAVSLSGIAAAALIVPGRTSSSDKAPAAASLTPSNIATPQAAASPAAPVAAASAPSSAHGDPAADNAPAPPPSAAGSSAPGAPTSAAGPPTTVKPTDKSSPSETPPPEAVAATASVAATDRRRATDAAVLADQRPATDSAAKPGASSTATDSPARVKASSSSDDAAAIASARQPSSERAERASERAAKTAGTSKQASAERSERTANERTATDRTATERTATERTATERTATERAGAERTAAAASPRGKRGESCESMDVDELMTRAAIQFDAGSATSALSFTRVALGCKQTDRMYWLAVMYACAAHDVANARLYFPKVPSGLQSGLETKCQRENLDVRSRKVD